MKDLGAAAKKLEFTQKSLTQRMDKLSKEITEIANERAFKTAVQELREEFDAKVLQYRTIHDRLDN